MSKNYMPKDKRLLPTEAEEQVRLFNWAKMHTIEYPELALMFHIPNGGKRNAAEAARFKAEGVKAGVPDIFLPVSNGTHHGLFIELKRQDGGRPSEAQTAWINGLKNQGYRAVICEGWEEASREISRYMENRTVGKTWSEVEAHYAQRNAPR